jgi:CRP-like cAMP-binding protein
VKYDSILASFAKHITLTEEEKALFISRIDREQVENGQFLEKKGQFTRNFIYVESGCLMTYYTDPNAQDHVVQFATAGWWTGDLQSYTKGTPSEYSTRALATSSVLLISLKEMDQLLLDIPKFERYFRIIYQNSLITHSQRIISNFSSNAEERYIRFQAKYPTLEQYVPLKYIASYLGITPEFLSKVRRKLMEK